MTEAATDQRHDATGLLPETCHEPHHCRHRRRFRYLAVSGHAAPVAAAPAVVAVTATLFVRFTGIATPTEAIMLSLFASEADFDAGGKPIASMMAPVTGDTA